MKSEKHSALLKVTGEVTTEQDFDFQELQQIAVEYQVADFATVVPNRLGIAVKLDGLLKTVGATSDAKFLGLHSSHDDFHASIPLDEVRSRGYLIYGRNDAPLPRDQGGPIRFFIPDHAQCNTEDVDECANVKYVDHLELTRSRSYDNRPTDDDAHAKLHQHDSC